MNHPIPKQLRNEMTELVDEFIQNVIGELDAEQTVGGVLKGNPFLCPECGDIATVDRAHDPAQIDTAEITHEQCGETWRFDSDDFDDTFAPGAIDSVESDDSGGADAADGETGNRMTFRELADSEADSTDSGDSDSDGEW